MDQEEARRRLAVARVGRLATVRPDGTPHVVPVVFAVVEDVLYTAVDSKPKTTTALQRLANIDATGRASVLVDRYAEDWAGLWWVRADGSARVLVSQGTENGRTVPTQAQPGQVGLAIKALTLKYPQYVDRPPLGSVIALSLTRWRWWEATTSS